MSGFAIGSETWPGTSKLIEEMGELGQVLGKLIATGGETEHWDGSDLRRRSEEEAGDVLAALEFFVETNGLRLHVIDARFARKLALFRQWHREQSMDGSQT